MRPRLWVFVFFLVIVTAQARTRAVRSRVSTENPPRLVSFSGQLFHPAAKGITGVTFAVYSDSEGGTPLWMETQNVDVDESGRFTVTLGAETSGGIPLDLFTSGQARWLAIIGSRRSNNRAFCWRASRMP